MARSTTSIVLVCGAAGLALSASQALAQVRAAFPGASRAGGATPMQRTFGSQPMSRPTSAPPPMMSTGGGNACGWGNQGGVIVDGSALVVNGAYTSDNFNLAFHLGGGAVDPGCGTVPIWNNCYYPGYYPGYYYGLGWYNNYYDGYYDNSYQHYAVVDGALVQPIFIAPATPPAAPAPPPPPPTDAELAAALLKSGDAQGAVEKYRVFLRDHADDAAAMRELAVALLLSGEPDQGIAMMSMAYRTDATLADRPLADEAVFKSDAELRKAVIKAVNFANKIKSASSWLTVAVLMQAESREENAMRMVDRASDLGLDAALVKKFKTALGQ